MKKILLIAALGEALTGLLLIVDPALVVRVLFASDIAGVSVVVSRIAGIALTALGIACWPGSNDPCYGMLTYSVLASVYLLYLGIGGTLAGILLWPGVAAHVILTILLVGTRFKERGS